MAAMKHAFLHADFNANVFQRLPADAVLASKPDGAAIFTKDLGFM
ncbi:hypothetical protein N7E02_16655 [Aliirhizobium terrae]|nr:hypothetical protein [Rhizobium sp. CC-CFT758]WJH41865.1 hypothetical protein N7E02_16655 [Rhizobium sp. CC-CFT758]